MTTISIMDYDDINKIIYAFRKSGQCDSDFEKYINRCYEQNATKERITFVAFVDNEATGYVNVIFNSSYPYFQINNIPEINDLYVLPGYRRRGIGKLLIEECESYISAEYYNIGLGVGLYKDYGIAQRLYTKNGYIPDGNGLMYKNTEVRPGNNVFVDDDLLIYLYKKIK